MVKIPKNTQIRAGLRMPVSFSCTLPSHSSQLVCSKALGKKYWMARCGFDYIHYEGQAAKLHKYSE